MASRRTSAADRPDEGTRGRAPADPATENILALTHILSNRIGQAFHDEVVAANGLTLAEWRVILTLAHAPGMTAAEITDRWAMDKMAINRAIRRLERAGRLSRRRRTDDRRSYALTLTPAGRRLYRKVVPTANARYRDLVACLTAEEQAALRTALAKLIARAQALTG